MQEKIFNCQNGVKNDKKKSVMMIMSWLDKLVITIIMVEQT
jgi:hypothetical protein